ncbi:hypothetical protein [Vannielia litorea]|uniref:hypothetical protein n=1 Tax=Vannielia litorea TaxID=1217970 RepID=UPI001BCD9576|nr:hypothetical protein [Vannielia litorea]
MAKITSLKAALFGSDDQLQEAMKAMYRRDSIFWDGLDSESDRGLVLCVGSYFENFLADCLRSYFAETKEAEDLLKATNGLGTFKARLECCRALRILNDEDVRALRSIAKVRNTFAHELTTRFDDPRIKDVVDDLYQKLGERFNASTESEDRRERYSLCCMLVGLDLHRHEINVLLHTKSYPEFIPSYLPEREGFGDRSSS